MSVGVLPATEPLKTAESVHFSQNGEPAKKWEIDANRILK